MSATAIIHTPVRMDDRGVAHVGSLNIGCGAYPLPDYVNVDLIKFEGVDIEGDFTKMVFAGVRVVEMSHILEHVSWQQVLGVLKLVRSWMEEGGSIRIEVPDMQVVMERGIYDMAAQIMIYGIQNARGEFHLGGFTTESLVEVMTKAGFEVISALTFVSDFPGRQGLPCIEVKGVAA